ncbi:hypothetical protein BGX28_005446 [Mortierella sp. GBA30]|nr:hypothetical protein BGX28_005446 [Mortierella sp. GBA30]
MTQGSILNLKGFGSIILPKEAEQCDSECELGQELAIHQFADGWTSVFTQITDNTTFRITASDKLVAVKSITVLQITVEDTEGVTVKSADIPMGAARIYHCGFYVPESSQLFILAGCYLQVWNISTTSSELCELAYIWKLREDDPKHATDFSHRTIESASVCPHGRQIQVTVSPNLWLDANANVIGDVTGVPNDLLTVPMSADDSIKLSEQYRIVNGVQYLPILYAGADLSVKRAIIRYLRKCVRPTPKHPESSLVTLCRMWSPENKSILEAMMGELLSAKNISWLPDVNAVKTNDPLAILLEIARTMPSVIAVVKIISAYCVSHANRNKNLAFMAPVFGSMHELMQIFPGEALECMNGISYIPARERSFLMDNHIVSYSPKARMQFWKDEKKPLAELKNPILQMHESVSEPDPRNQNFTLPIFVAAFDALWNYKDDTKSKSKQEALAKTARRNGTTWWKTLYHMIAVKLHLWSHTYVEGHNFTLEFFDNPAIAALVAYKWNTIGFMYWSTRFFFQFIFYILVTTAALMQVYHHGLAQRDLVGIFISIIVFGAVFLWFELLQAVKNWSRYTNIYNFLDMVAYTVPVAASIDQLMILYRNDTTGNARILSFSVLAIFVHMLFELRINKSVCKYVTIIQETVAEIRVFFFIFAGGILAFTIATLHLLRACPVLGECGEPTTKFSGHIVGALSATYFFMGGRYDPVNDELDSNDWGFHSMMVIYFFFTVIVMLNVLIALINVAFLRGDENWRLVWIESRLRYIESAENMSYHIPGFRQSHNWFPREIFYSATLEEVKAYRKRQQSRTNADEDRDLLKDLGRDEDDDEVDDRQGCLLTHKVEPSKVLLASDGNTTTRSIRGSIRADERKPNEGLGRRERSPTEDTMLKNAYYGNANERRHPSNNQKNQVENGANLSQNENQHQDDSSASVGELKKQVVQLQKQMTEQLKAQQQMHEQSQKQLQELRELFFRGNSALGLD